MAKKTKKLTGLEKTNKVVWLVAGLLTIILTIYTFFILADLQNLVP